LKILEEIISRLPLEKLKTFGDEFFYIKDINKSIEKLKREGVTPETLADYAGKGLKAFAKISNLYHEKGKYQGQMKGDYIDLEKQLKKLAELADIYTAYQHELEKRREYDYNDMILETKMALEINSELRLILQEQYQYLLVDEHQDTNNAQNKVLELLADFYDEPNLFVVGDEKQAIYKFQGASLENFLYFKQKYPNARVVWLENNYRSSQLVLDAAHSLLAREHRLLAKAGHLDKPIKLYEFTSELTEDYFVAKDIKERISGGVPADEIAVFYRNNTDVESLRAMLERLGVPFVIEANQDLLADNDLRKIIIFLQAVNDFGNEELFFQALHLDFLNIDPLAIYRLASQRREDKTRVFDVITDDKIIAAKQIMNELAKAAHNLPLAKFFERAVRESGYLNSLLAGSDPILTLRKLQRFFDEVKKLVERHKHAKLKDLIDYLEHLEKHELTIKQNPGGLVKGRVRLMTAHKSKGLEFDYVYIIRVADGRWGNKRSMEKIKLPPELFSITGELEEVEDKNDDERRLFYVALTRARQSLTVSYGRLREDGREQVISQFVTELDQNLLTREETKSTEEELENKPEVIFSAPAEVNLKLEKEFIKELFLKQGLAVTHLNNYLECPWRYFYTNLLRIPQAPVAAQMYGIAVHATLKDFFDRLNPATGLGTQDPNYLLEKFVDYLGKQPMVEKDYERLLSEGKKFLIGYYDSWQGSWIINT
ncbi:MAG: ATP-dependent DNA helicase, partial [bacterium]